MNVENTDYLFIPPKVRYCIQLPPNAKLLYGVIANRTNEKGLSLFGNQELADIFRVDKQSIYHWVTALEKEGFIKSRNLRKKLIHYRCFLIVDWNTPDPNQPGKP